MNLINQIFQNISMAIFTPLLLMLTALFIFSIYKAIQFFLSQKNEREFWSQFKSAPNETLKKDLLVSDRSPLKGVFAYVQSSFAVELNPDVEFSEAEIYYDKLKFWSKTMIRLGPVLGLLGTLIPLGPALGGLANGDTQTMAQNMQIAFATTVIGMLIGGVGFLLHNSERQKYARELSVLEWFLESKKRGEADAS